MDRTPSPPRRRRPSYVLTTPPHAPVSLQVKTCRRKGNSNNNNNNNNNNNESSNDASSSSSNRSEGSNNSSNNNSSSDSESTQSTPRPARPSKGPSGWNFGSPGSPPARLCKSKNTGSSSSNCCSSSGNIRSKDKNNNEEDKENKNKNIDRDNDNDDDGISQPRWLQQCRRQPYEVISLHAAIQGRDTSTVQHLLQGGYAGEYIMECSPPMYPLSWALFCTSRVEIFKAILDATVTLDRRISKAVLQQATELYLEQKRAWDIWDPHYAANVAHELLFAGAVGTHAAVMARDIGCLSHIKELTTVGCSSRELHAYVQGNIWRPTPLLPKPVGGRQDGGLPSGLVAKVLEFLAPAQYVARGASPRSAFLEPFGEVRAVEDLDLLETAVKTLLTSPSSG